MIDWDAFYAYDRELANAAWIARAATNTLVARLAGVDKEVFEAMQTDGVVAGEEFGLDAKALLNVDISKLTFMSNEQFEQQLKELMPNLVSIYGEVAAQTALEFYTGQRKAYGLKDDYLPTLPEQIPEEFILDDIDKALETVKKYSNGSSYESYLRRHGDKFASNLAGHVQKNAMKSADNTIIHNAKRDPAKPRWAFIARPGACGFCIMISSGGFRYTSESSALKLRHTNCYCPVVADFDTDNPYLDGYDPDEYKKQYAKGIDDAGGEDGIRARWNELPPEEQAKYKRKGRSAYDVFKTTQITKAMDERVRRNQLDARTFELAKFDANSRFGVEGARELADALSASMSARKSWFLSQVTQKRYDEAIGSFLADVGKIYGMEIMGEFASGPKLYSALPDGDEIWALTRMGELFNTVQFLSTDRCRKKGNPDLLVNGEYIDIKTLRVVEKTEDRLHEGYMQCRNRGQDHGVVLLSALRLNPEDERFFCYANSTVNRKSRRGQPLHVYVIHGDSSIDELG